MKICLKGLKKKKSWPVFKAVEQKQVAVFNLANQRAAEPKGMLRKWNHNDNGMKIVTLLADMREICKVFSLTVLRNSIIVRKLEILPKLAGSLSLFQHHPLRSQKKQTAREWKRSHLWDALYTEHTFCHQSECFELLDAIKALDNDCRRLYHLLLFSHTDTNEALSVTCHSLL